MNWERVEGNWKQVKGKIKEQWGKLTDDHLDKISGKREQLISAQRVLPGMLRHSKRRSREPGQRLGKPQPRLVCGGFGRS